MPAHPAASTGQTTSTTESSSELAPGPTGVIPTAGESTASSAAESNRPLLPLILSPSPQSTQPAHPQATRPLVRTAPPEPTPLLLTAQQAHRTAPVAEHTIREAQHTEQAPQFRTPLDRCIARQHTEPRPMAGLPGRTPLQPDRIPPVPTPRLLPDRIPQAVAQPAAQSLTAHPTTRTYLSFPNGSLLLLCLCRCPLRFSFRSVAKKSASTSLTHSATRHSPSSPVSCGSGASLPTQIPPLRYGMIR